MTPLPRSRRTGQYACAGKKGFTALRSSECRAGFPSARWRSARRVRDRSHAAGRRGNCPVGCESRQAAGAPDQSRRPAAKRLNLAEARSYHRNSRRRAGRAYLALAAAPLGLRSTCFLRKRIPPLLKTCAPAPAPPTPKRRRSAALPTQSMSLPKELPKTCRRRPRPFSPNAKVDPRVLETTPGPADREESIQCLEGRSRALWRRCIPSTHVGGSREGLPPCSRRGNLGYDGKGQAEIAKGGGSSRPGVRCGFGRHSRRIHRFRARGVRGGCTLRVTARSGPFKVTEKPSTAIASEVLAGAAKVT